MNPVERYYRRLVRLLPPEERAARGEELLGLLLDMEEGRARPSPQETAALLWLVARRNLRSARAARLGVSLLGVFLIVLATEPVATVIPTVLFRGAGPHFYSGSVPPALFELVSLSAAIAWALGAYRTTLTLYTATAASSIWTAYTIHAPSNGTWIHRYTFGNPGEFVSYILSCIVVPVALAVVARRKPARGPVAVGLTCIAIAIAVQDFTEPFWSPDIRFLIFNATWILGAACAATIALYARRSAWFVLIALVAAGFVAGTELYTLMPTQFWLDFVVTALAGKAAVLLVARLARARRRTPAVADGPA
ncbi:MAG TPA: hypothetical protein VGM10_12770 [Actinocrinis sp.]